MLFSCLLLFQPPPPPTIRSPPLGCSYLASAAPRIPRPAVLLAGGTPERRIVRDEFGNPIQKKKSGRRGRGGRGRGGSRGRGNNGSPTHKPEVGDLVSIVEKANYGTDIRVNGTVSRVLTRASQHPRGFKVMLTSGVVGRCTQLIQTSALATRRSSSSTTSDEEGAISSDDYLASIEPPPPGIRLRDLET